ncbi:RNA polymerase sigma factor [Pedobacter sp. SL55]|uniref:RNA polymerase sigma factor n=1 Tax=Pedobacter sp. SL55 TaxID=2995161 RepID=UPI00226F8F47|nr:sigma-70 family RNA polymerase sigma factor [Pedobacter sp. SL55]WAC41564.1 sigma-70 family RNA polymerase sigma factor [Pedobacter sp. SL55]
MNVQIKLSEQEIVALLLKQDEKGFNYLYDNYAGAIYGIITKVVSEKEYADEIIQDVFVKIWKNIVQFDPEKGRLYTWMINLARNTAIDYVRSKGYQNQQKNQTIPEFVNESEQYATALNVDHIGMKDILAQLKSDWRELIELAYFKGYTQQEIAERLDIPIGTIKTRTRNALIELKRLLKDYR